MMRFTILLGLSLFAGQASVTAQETKADVAGFRERVAPFFKAHCTRCHGETKQMGKLRLDQLNGDLLAAKADLQRWQHVAERLHLGEMPPEGEPQPDPELAKKIVDWIDGEMIKAGQPSITKAGSLRSGNHVPHDLLFGPKATGSVPPPQRLWRISPAIYLELVKGINKNAKVGQPFAIPSGDGFKDLAAGFTIDDSTMAQLLRNAEVLVNHQLGLEKFSKIVKEFEPLINEKNPPSQAQVKAAIAKQFDIVLKRAPTAEEMEKLLALHEKNVKTGGALIGTRTTLMTVLMNPGVYFRSELGGGPEAKQILAPREIAFALAYALTDRPPSPDLLALAQKGKLASPADVAVQTRRMLDDPKLDRPRILRFFREYFGYAEATNVFKDMKDFPSHNPRALVEDTDRLILHILGNDKDVLRELLTTPKSFVSYKQADMFISAIEQELKKAEENKKKNPTRPIQKSNKHHYVSYNLDRFPPSAQQPIELPKTQRAGILTQPAWLVAFSENKDNHAIRRGKWVHEHLLGGTVPDIPIGVDAQLPEDPKKTLRERMEVTKKEYCWQCHKRMNPIGLTFENFDGFGRHRVKELNKPVDATGVIAGLGDKRLDGDVPDSLALIRKLADSERVRQVFVRHAFRYWMGRDETPGDALSLQAVDKTFVESGGSMKGLIVAILSSEAYLYRKGVNSK